jgi:hypothetical protein
MQARLAVSKGTLEGAEQAVEKLRSWGEYPEIRPAGPKQAAEKGGMSGENPEKQSLRG